MEGKSESVSIDLTPTWRGVLPALIAVLEDGTGEGKRMAREELANMASVADYSKEVVSQRDALSEQVAAMREALHQGRMAVAHMSASIALGREATHDEACRAISASKPDSAIGRMSAALAIGESK